MITERQVSAWTSYEDCPWLAVHYFPSQSFQTLSSLLFSQQKVEIVT